MEIAFVSSNKIHIEIEKKQVGFLSKLLSKITAKPSKFIATMLIGNNIALVVYGLYMGDVLMAWFSDQLATNSLLMQYFFDELSLLPQTLISTLVILLTAEFLPKVFFQIYANKLLKLLALPAFLFYLLFSFLSDFVIWISDFVLKTFFKTKGDEVQLAFTKVDLGNYITEQMESVAVDEEVDNEIMIFQNALDFGNVKLRECMVPRTEIISIEINQSINDLLKLFIKTNLSKIIVFEENIDKIIGYVHSSEMYKSPDSIKSILRPVPFVPESMHANELLEVFSKQRKGIATIVDEFGGTSGIVTVEDVVEEIFGEIEDEHDAETLLEKQVNDSTFLFSARLEVDYVNDKYHLELPLSNEYETLSGLLISYLENIPKKEEKLNIDGYEIIVKKVSDTKIEQVCVIKA